MTGQQVTNDGPSQSQEEKGNQPPNKNSKCRTCKKTDCFVNNSRGQPQKTSSKWISCDMCQEWFHGLCQNLQNPEIATIVKLNNRGVKWFCDSCVSSVEAAARGDEGSDLTTLAQCAATNQKLHNIEDVMNSISIALSSNKAAIEDRLVTLEKSYADATKQSTENIKKTLEANDSAKELLAKNLEFSQAEVRKNNAILYGIEECEGTSAHDQVLELMKKDCFQRTKQPLRSIRLNTKATGRPRPIKLEFSDEATKWEFLKRANASLRCQNIFCKLDESKEARDQQYKMRQTIKQMKEINTDTEYRIRSNKIQNKIQGEWKYVNPATQRQHQTTI